MNNFKILKLQVTPTLDTNATSAGDVLCATTALTGPTLMTTARMELVGITVLDKADQGAALDVVLLNSATDLGTAGAAVSISDSNAANILRVARIEADDYIDLVGSQFADVDYGKPLQIANEDGALYLGLIDRTGSKTYGASDLIVTVYLRADEPR